MWLKEGLDLKMVTFQCIPTGDKKGMIEMITDAETLRKIQVEWGLTGSFKGCYKNGLLMNKYNAKLFFLQINQLQSG